MKQTQAVTGISAENYIYPQQGGYFNIGFYPQM